MEMARSTNAKGNVTFHPVFTFAGATGDCSHAVVVVWLENRFSGFGPGQIVEAIRKNSVAVGREDF